MRRLATWRRSLGTDEWDVRIQTSFAVGIAFVVTLVSAVALSRVHATTAVALGVMAALAALSGWVFAFSGALAFAGLGWLMINGFVADRYGELHWHGRSDVVNLLVLVGAAGTVSALRAVQIRRDRRLAFDHFTQQLSELSVTAPGTLGGRHA